MPSNQVLPEMNINDQSNSLANKTISTRFMP